MPKGRGRKDSDSDAATEEQSTVGTFETLRDEGEHFVHVKQYQKAIESFSKALEMKPGDKTCLVTRSKCYLMLGNSQAALADAEAALEQDEEEGKKDIRALCMKAEALYQKGDFETALVYYHRGNKLRPELQEFRLGIQKSQEAINNSIGTPDAVRLEASGDLSFFYKQEEKQKQQQQKGYSKPQTQKREEKKERGKPQGTGSSKTTKELLGELHKDKVYLDKLYDSMVSNSTDTDEYIKGRAADGLEYLNTRADFWRQQKPMYARKRDRQRKQQQNAGSRTDPHGEQDPMQYILERLEDIDDAQANGEYDKSLKKSQNTLKKVESWGNDRVKNKPALVANLYSCMGNAYLEQSKFKEALDCHNKDLSIGEEENIEEAVSRALDNLGRTKAKMGKYEDAIEIWEKKLPKSKSALESTWLFHEIGRCYLELGQYSNAKDYGEKSFAAAKEADDRGWQLHASVLVAQAEVKCEELEAAVDSFERAKEIAEELKDDSAQLAIKKALEEVNTRIVKGETVDYKDDDAGADDDGRRSVKSDASGGSTKGGLRKGHEDKAEDPKDKHAKDRANEEMRDHKKEEDGNQEKDSKHIFRCPQSGDSKFFSLILDYMVSEKVDESVDQVEPEIRPVCEESPTPASGPSEGSVCFVCHSADRSRADDSQRSVGFLGGVSSSCCGSAGCRESGSAEGSHKYWPSEGPDSAQSVETSCANRITLNCWRNVQRYHSSLLSVDTSMHCTCVVSEKTCFTGQQKSVAPSTDLAECIKGCAGSQLEIEKGDTSNGVISSADACHGRGRGNESSACEKGRSVFLLVPNSRQHRASDYEPLTTASSRRCPLGHCYLAEHSGLRETASSTNQPKSEHPAPRSVRRSFASQNSACQKDEEESVGRFASQNSACQKDEEESVGSSASSTWLNKRSADSGTKRVRHRIPTGNGKCADAEQRHRAMQKRFRNLTSGFRQVEKRRSLVNPVWTRLADLAGSCACLEVVRVYDPKGYTKWREGRPKREAQRKMQQQSIKRHPLAEKKNCSDKPLTGDDGDISHGDTVSCGAPLLSCRRAFVNPLGNQGAEIKGTRVPSFSTELPKPRCSGPAARSRTRRAVVQPEHGRRCHDDNHNLRVEYQCVDAM